MKHFLRKTLSLLLALTLVSSLGLPASASVALGDDLTAADTLLNEGTELSTNVFWSTSKSDLRTENLITYSPNRDVTPIVTFGSSLTERSTVSAMAGTLEAEDLRVVAGINGDFYNVGSGLPIGIVITEGLLRSGDAGHPAIGFYQDGTAILGKPGVTVTADMGYDLLNEYGTPTQVVRKIAGINKARVSDGGIYLYTHDFNGSRTTGNTEPGVDVVCSVVRGDLAIGETLTLRVEDVVEASAATPVAEDQIVLSANLKSGSYYVDALRFVPVGKKITLDITANEGWEDVDYALGSLYSLVENGAVVPGLPSGVNPRTAVGQTADGTLIFYTIDGRRPGHSIGASLTQTAQRMVELGCVTALCLDGGGSTTLAVTAPDQMSIHTVNRPSDGRERSVSNHLFLVADNDPSGRLSHFYIKPDSRYVLAGSRVRISASAVDTHFIPMDRSYDLETSAGTLDGNVLTTPKEGGEVIVTASSGSKEGSASIYAVTDPDSITVRNSKGNIVSRLELMPGSSASLTPSAVYRHLPLKADPDAFTWKVSGGIGTIDENGLFTASAPGTGTIIVSAGGKQKEIAVTVSKTALKAVETFEGPATLFDGTGSLSFRLTSAADQVRLGRSAGRLDYDLNAGTNYTAELRFAPIQTKGSYTTLNLWVCGDGSGNTLELLGSDGTTAGLPLLSVLLDFTGWRLVTVTAWGPDYSLEGLRLTAPQLVPSEDGSTIVLGTPTTPLQGTVFLDQLVAAFPGAVDSAVPEVTISSTENGTLSASLRDAMDGLLPASAVSLTLDGEDHPFHYDASSGRLSASYTEDGRPHRLTITARDASGNIGRASYDVPQGADWAPVFSDTQGYWGAVYVDFLYTSGITTGYTDGTFRPALNISRQQFAAMLYRYLDLDTAQTPETPLPFADLDAIGAYALPAVEALYSMGIINGTTGADGRLYFHPGDSLTRAQAAAMIGRTQEKGYALQELTFSDAGSIPSYAAGYIQAMVSQGVISGYPDGSFKPQNSITRGQMAKILYNLL